MQLVTILNKANESYADSFLATYYDEKTGAPKNGSGDSLAEFIVNEIRETYDDTSSVMTQIEKAQRAIQNAIESLDGVQRSLGELLS